MSRVSKHSLAIAALGAVLLLVNLGGSTLFDEDEPKNAACGQEMLERGDYLVPWFNGELRTDKPILLYWLMLLAYSVGGVSEFTARLTSAVCGIATAVVVYHLGRILFRPAVGAWASVILFTCLMFEVVARAATPDSLFVFLTTSALLAFVWGVDRATSSGDDRKARQGATACLPTDWRAFVAMYALMGLAVLAKGPAGFVLPFGVIWTFRMLAAMAAERVWSEQLATGWKAWLSAAWRTPWFSAAWRAFGSLRPALGLAVIAAIVAPWYVAVGVATDGAWLAGFLGHHNLGRFTQPLEGHRGPFFYYAVALVIGMFPWSIFFPATLAEIRRSLGHRDERMPSFLFVTAWALVILGIFTLARTKLPNYVLPAYPAIALALATFVERWLRRPDMLAHRSFRIAIGSYALTGAGMIIGLGVAAYLLFPDALWLSAVGLIPLGGAAAVWWFQRQQRSEAAALAFGGSAVLLSLALFGVAADAASAWQTSPAIAALAREAGAPLATYEFFEPSLVFYHARPVTRIHDARELAKFVAGNPRACVVTTRERLAEIESKLPDGMSVVWSRPRFLRSDEEVVVLARGAVIAEREGARRR